MERTKDGQERNRVAYIVEAALEYFISLLVTDAFLATLLTRTGVSDAAAGVITQLASLAFVAQLFSVFVRKTRGMKRWVTALHLADQLMFVSLYLIPILRVPAPIKIALFVVMYLGGHILANVASPYKLSWLMSFVPDGRRGRFTADKEIVSLIGGMTFTYLVGTLVDTLRDNGKEDLAFLICGVLIFVLALLHLVSLLVVKDRADAPEQATLHVRLSDALRKTFSDRTLQKIVFVDVLWHLATGVSVSFYGVYKIHELGFSLRYVSFLAILYSLFRIAFSRLFGSLADRSSWTRMLTVCFGVAALAYFFNVFTVPSNGKWMFALYSCVNAISMAGINSGLLNLVFDFVPYEDRAAALGVKYAIGGLAAFAASLVGGVILAQIQNNGNTLFGVPLYAQQVLSALAFLLCLVLVWYLNAVIRKLPRLKDEEKK